VRDDFGVRYVNCGDWVESCTAVAEHDDGRFEIITWTNARAEPEPEMAEAHAA
jgi:UDP-2,3-diacylglucosamine pyrophosphatase LpxH